MAKNGNRFYEFNARTGIKGLFWRSTTVATRLTARYTEQRVSCKKKDKDMNEQYWVVGATWGGTEDVLPQFIKRGYWYCWDANQFENEKSGVGNTIKNQQERFELVKPGDRIAVKRLLGKGASEMAILAIGIVKDVDINEWRIYVDWVMTDIKDRHAPLKGCAASIHGPFTKSGNDAAWVHEVFCL